jgi:putative membrane protein
MSTLFAFLHHLCAFTLVSAVAIEFTLIRGELTLASARRLQSLTSCSAFPPARCW